MKILRLLKKYNLLLFYFVTFLFLEVTFKLSVGFNLFTVTMLSTIIYLIFMSFVCFILSKLLSKKGNKLITYFITISHCLYFAIQFGSYEVFHVYFSISASDSAAGVLEFKNEIINVIKDYFINFVLFLLPIIVLIIISKKLNFKKIKRKQIAISSASSVLLLTVYLLTLSTNGIYSAKALTFNYKDMGLTVNKLGLNNAGHLDTLKTIVNFQEKVTFTSTGGTEVFTPGQRVYDLNTLDIDFSSINNNSTISNMSDYFESETGTYKNEYTGMFKDKNLILIMAESFSDIAVDEELTPTLYKLIHEGFDFTNYYSPTIFSTIGGEYQMLTGLYPSMDAIKQFQAGTNTYSQGIADLFEEYDYATNAYHNNSYTFQSRNKYIPAVGFDNFLACNNGLEELMPCTWLQSDQDLMNSTFDLYSDEEKFFTFFATVSGHGAYDSSHSIAKQYLDLVDGDYSTATRYYLASQIELDRAVEALINNLDEKGILEDTVIVLAGDHYPYLLTNSQINEAADYNKDDVIDINKSNLIIWNSEMNPVVIDKVGSQIDILPTLFNLFGIDYDSRITIGKDILSTNEGLAIFGNRSWISDQGRYYYSNSKFIANEGFEYDEDYVTKMNMIVSTKISIRDRKSVV